MGDNWASRLADFLFILFFSGANVSLLVSKMALFVRERPIYHHKQFTRSLDCNKNPTQLKHLFIQKKQTQNILTILYRQNK